MQKAGRRRRYQTALITGGSRGLGAEIARELVATSWEVILDARNAGELEETRREAACAPGARAPATGIAGDIGEAGHRRALRDAAQSLGGLDALVCNAAQLGVAPLPPVLEYSLDALAELFFINTLAQLALVQELSPILRPGAAVVAVTSDAAIESYPGWGGYGATKAALERLFSVLAVELQGKHRVYLFDPGDIRTAMHQQAFPGENIDDRPHPGTVAPAVVRLLQRDLPDGRYRAADLLAMVPG